MEKYLTLKHQDASLPLQTFLHCENAPDVFRWDGCVVPLHCLASAALSLDVQDQDVQDQLCLGVCRFDDVRYSYQLLSLRNEAGPWSFISSLVSLSIFLSASFLIVFDDK